MAKRRAPCKRRKAARLRRRNARALPGAFARRIRAVGGASSQDRLVTRV
ncbi:hypothetical protein BURPS668_A1618 [Burkholderia pseudomallei 668]|nr:hypothetical protein BURPS668_A1618 [Burkholderia pseudomallei 668]